MTKETILKYLKKHKNELYKKYGIIKIGLFGSYARNEANDNSDIDLLIELEKDTKNIYEKKQELKKILEDKFHTKVDIAREKYLKKFAKNEILKDICYV